jgi:hypothetical protein
MCGVEPETGEGAQRPGTERSTRCPLQELAPVDLSTLRLGETSG